MTSALQDTTLNQSLAESKINSVRTSICFSLVEISLGFERESKRLCVENQTLIAAIY